jgi:photosystem II stability/assembly factor-like uncharacterized protein
MRPAALESVTSAIKIVMAQNKEPPRSALSCMVMALALTVAGLALVPPTLSAQPVETSSSSLAKPWDSFFSTAFLSSGKCYVVGAEGALLASADGGKTWTRRAIAQRGDLSWWDLYSIRFTPDGKVGWIGGEKGLILKTADGGATWDSQPSGTTENIFRIDAVNSNTAYASGSNGLLMSTTDGGAHWQQQIQKSGLIFFDLAFPDSQNGWAVGEFETILHTADGGKTWTPQMGGKRANFKLPALFAVRFADAQHGWAAGQGGTLLRTDNGGANWLPIGFADVQRGVCRRVWGRSHGVVGVGRWRRIAARRSGRRCSDRSDPDGFQPLRHLIRWQQRSRSRTGRHDCAYG